MWIRLGKATRKRCESTCGSYISFCLCRYRYNILFFEQRHYGDDSPLLQLNGHAHQNYTLDLDVMNDKGVFGEKNKFIVPTNSEFLAAKFIASAMFITLSRKIFHPIKQKTSSQDTFARKRTTGINQACDYPLKQCAYI